LHYTFAAARGRFRGLRLVHTHLRGEPLTRDDLTDLALLRLDLVAAVAKRRPAWTFVLLGQIMVDVEKLRAQPNVHLLGRKPLAVLRQE
jgi:GTP-binding protein HflX